MSFKNVIRRIATASLVVLSLGATGCATFGPGQVSGGMLPSAPPGSTEVAELVVETPNVPDVVIEAASRQTPTQVPVSNALRSPLQCWVCR